MASDVSTAMRLCSMADGPRSVVSTAPILALDAVGPSTPTLSVQDRATGAGAEFGVGPHHGEFDLRRDGCLAVYRRAGNAARVGYSLVRKSQPLAVFLKCRHLILVVESRASYHQIEMD